jgi:hypothetical protein
MAGYGVSAKGSVNSSVIATQDLLPTVLKVCGVSLPQSCDGVPFVDALKGETVRRDQSLYWHYPHYSNQGGKPGGAVRSHDWKLIEYYENQRRELYDLQSDPGEKTNRASERPELVEKLSQLLADWRTAVHAQLMTPNPAYRPNPQMDDGRILMPAKYAEVTGTQLRYEPLPYKDTLGFWTKQDDTARWEFELTKPGRFMVQVLQGCGPGSGGSQVDIEVAGQVLHYTVQETGGFQKFERVEAGIVELRQPGRWTCHVRPRSKPGLAVMDLREITLVPVP